MDQKHPLRSQKKQLKDMQPLALLLVASIAVASTWAANNGPITITVNGQKVTKYVLSAEGDRGFVHLNSTAIMLKGGGRVYLGDSDSDTFSPNSFYEMPLLGKRLTYDADYSDVGCNCNGALYLVSMPAYNSAQQPNPGSDGAYYCDANEVGGTYCPEMDVAEANKYAMASTAHTCNYIPPHYYSSCDRGGCGTNVLDQYLNEFGPGKELDTNHPYTLSVAFNTEPQKECGSSVTLSSVTNTFTQFGKTLQFNSCNADYLQWMGCSLPGIVMTMSLWGTGDGGMSWLDGKSGCHGACDLGASQVIFSNIRLDDL